MASAVVGYTDLEGRAACTVRLWADGVVTVFRHRLFETNRTLPRHSSVVRRYRVRKRQVRASAFSIFSNSSRVYFVTMTFPSSLSFDDRIERVHRFARYLSKEISSRSGITGYVWVLERHASGAVHAHFIIGLDSSVRPKIWRRSLVSASERWTSSPNGLDVKLVRSYKKASSYISKYCTKTASDPENYFSVRAYGCGGVARFRVRVFRDVFVARDSGVFFVPPRLFLSSDSSVFDYLLSRSRGLLAPASVAFVYLQSFSLVSTSLGGIGISWDNPVESVRSLPVLQYCISGVN